MDNPRRQFIFKYRNEKKCILIMDIYEKGAIHYLLNEKNTNEETFLNLFKIYN